MDHQTIERSVLKKITPGSGDRKKVNALARKIIEDIIDICRKMNLKDVHPILVGSVAKDTYLKQVDLDIFMMFPPGLPREELERLGLLIGYEILPDAIELYAEHPYLRGTKNGVNIDLVPCYNIKSSTERLSAVDRTPFHTEYVKKYLTEELKKDVRLFKRFLKGIGAYGAEVRIQGFSGYICEVLVIEYGGFHQVLNACCKWQIPGEIIVPNSIRSGFDHAALGKFTEPLIVIDPIDISRNVAAPISEDILKLIKHAAECYLTAPSRRFFFPNTPKPLSKRELNKAVDGKDTLLAGVEIRTRTILPDILYSQVRKSLKAAITVLQRHEFSVARSNFYTREKTDDEHPIRILLLMLLDRYELPDKQVHRGPPLDHPNADRFLKKWSAAKNNLSEPYRKAGRWYVDVRREYTNALDLLEHEFADLNHGKQLNECIQKGDFTILSGDVLLDSGYNAELTMFLLNKRPWEY